MHLGGDSRSDNRTRWAPEQWPQDPGSAGTVVAYSGLVVTALSVHRGLGALLRSHLPYWIRIFWPQHREEAASANINFLKGFPFLGVNAAEGWQPPVGLPP